MSAALVMEQPGAAQASGAAEASHPVAPAGPSRAAAPAAGKLAVEVIDSEAGLTALRAEWAELADSARAGTMFLTYEWLFPWWQHFGTGRELCTLAVRDGGTLVGLLPLFSERVKYGGVPVRRVAFLGDGDTGCDHLDVLAARGREAAVLEACLGKLGELPWDLLDLDGILRDSPTVLRLSERVPSGRAVRSDLAGFAGTQPLVRDGRLRFVCPHIPLAGTYESYLAGLGRRENLRRREKWLARQPGVSFELAQTPQDAKLAMERFFELHRARWAGEGGSDGLADERFERFHRQAAQLLAERGKLRMFTLFAARRPVASVYGVVHGKTFFYYQSGYEPAWGSRSVGLVLLARSVQTAYAEGFEDFDFLRGNEGYKANWARGERWTVQVRLWRGQRGRAAQAAELAVRTARETVKAALPLQIREGVKKMRRVLRSGRPLQALFGQTSSEE